MEACASVKTVGLKRRSEWTAKDSGEKHSGRGRLEGQCGAVQMQQRQQLAVRMAVGW